MGHPMRRFPVILLLVLAVTQSSLGQRQRRPYHQWNRGKYQIPTPVEHTFLCFFARSSRKCRPWWENRKKNWERNEKIIRGIFATRNRVRFSDNQYLVYFYPGQGGKKEVKRIKFRCFLVKSSRDRSIQRCWWNRGCLFSNEFQCKSHVEAKQLPVDETRSTASNFYRVSVEIVSDDCFPRRG